MSISFHIFQIYSLFVVCISQYHLTCVRIFQKLVRVTLPGTTAQRQGKKLVCCPIMLQKCELPNWEKRSDCFLCGHFQFFSGEWFFECRCVRKDATNMYRPRLRRMGQDENWGFPYMNLSTYVFYFEAVFLKTKTAITKVLSYSLQFFSRCTSTSLQPSSILLRSTVCSTTATSTNVLLSFIVCTHVLHARCSMIWLLSDHSNTANSRALDYIASRSPR